MSAVKLVEKLFEGTPVRFDSNGWFSATDASAMFNYRLDNWFDSPSTRRRMIIIAKSLIELDNSNSLDSRELEFEEARSTLVRVKQGRRGGGTWLHPELAFFLALSIDDVFAFWVKKQIEHIAAGNRSQVDWYLSRYRAKATFKDKCGAIKYIHPNATSMDYVKAANEILFAVFGSFKHTGENDRDNLSEPMLELISVLQDFQMIKFLEARLENPEDQDIHNRELRPHLVRMATYHRERLGLPAITHTVAGKEYLV